MSRKYRKKIEYKFLSVNRIYKIFENYLKLFIVGIVASFLSVQFIQIRDYGLATGQSLFKINYLQFTSFFGMFVWGLLLFIFIEAFLKTSLKKMRLKFLSHDEKKQILIFVTVLFFVIIFVVFINPIIIFHVG